MVVAVFLPKTRTREELSRRRVRPRPRPVLQRRYLRRGYRQPNDANDEEEEEENEEDTKTDARDEDGVRSHESS